MGTHFKISRWKVVAASSALALGISAAYAAIVIGPDGVIHACYDKKGMLRIVASESNCTSNETPISWNQQGPEGDKGDKGDKGDPGEQGPPGDTTPPDPVMVGSVQIEDDSYPIFAFEGSIAVETSDVAGGGGAGKPHLSRIFVQRDAGVDTPKLSVDTASGRHFRTVSIEVFTSPAADESLLVELEDVSLGLLNTTETPHAKTRETIGFDFGRIAWSIANVTASYDVQRAEGGGGGGDIENFYLLDRGGTADTFPSPAWSLARSFKTGIERDPGLFGGGGASAPKFQDLVIERGTDVATIKHLGHAVTGRHSPESELDVTAPDDSGEAQAFLRYGLEDLLVTGVALKTDAAGNLIETLALDGRRLEWEYVPDHQLGTWDTILNQK
jgi:type VI protein secretion system component Hcp